MNRALASLARSRALIRGFASQQTPSIPSKVRLGEFFSKNGNPSVNKDQAKVLYDVFLSSNAGYITFIILGGGTLSRVF
jgi:hypothetical protein